MLKVGDVAPDFSLTNQHGEVVQLSDLLQKNKVVLYFYPKNETRGCTIESCSFRDHYSVFQEHGAEVVGVSIDSVKSHQSFAKNHQLGFQLLSDKGNKVRKAYKVPNTLFFIPGRVTFVINQDRKIILVFNSATQFDQHIQEALQAVKKN